MTVWIADWSWYGRKAFGSCTFTTEAEAVKYAISQALVSMDWEHFPDPAKLYPYDDRDGSHIPVLTPVFRATWATEGGGWSQVTKTTVSTEYNWLADYQMKRVEEIFKKIMGERPQTAEIPPNVGSPT